MTACFKVEGKQPVVMDKLMMREIGPARRWTNFFTSCVGRGSRLQDVVLEELMSLVTSSLKTGTKRSNCMSYP
jgi:hypothetical protein